MSERCYKCETTCRCAEIAELKVENTRIKAGWDFVNEANKKLNGMLRMEKEESEQLREVLDRLARLGNEPHYGTSTGNNIAIAALEKPE